LLLLPLLLLQEMGDAGQEARAVKAQGISEARLLRSQLSAKEADLVAARAANGILKEQVSSCCCCHLTV
jgi:tRNA C32,U32 (ribose-2'-O)-methylase TrmJ